VPAHHGADLKRAAAKKADAGPSAAPGRGASPEAPSRSAAETEPAAETATNAEDWQIPVLQTVAETGEGVEKLAEALDEHRTWLEASGRRADRRRQRLLERVRDEVERRIRARVWRDGGSAALDDALSALERGDTTPYQVAAEIVERVGRTRA